MNVITPAEMVGLAQAALLAGTGLVILASHIETHKSNAINCTSQNCIVLQLKLILGKKYFVVLLHFSLNLDHVSVA